MSVICGLSFHYVIWIGLAHVCTQSLLSRFAQVKYLFLTEPEHVDVFVRSALQHYRMQCHCILLYCQRFKRQQTHKKIYIRMNMNSQCCLCWRAHLPCGMVNCGNQHRYSSRNVRSYNTARDNNASSDALRLCFGRACTFVPFLIS